MREFQFDHGEGRQPVAPPGRIILNVRNDGKLAHDISLLAIPDDMPLTLEEQIKSKENRPFISLLELPPRPPTSTAALAMDLTPGRYGLVCLIRDPDGKLHAEKGMSSEFRVWQPQVTVKDG